MREEEETELEQLRLELMRRERHIRALDAEFKVRTRWDDDLRLTAENLDAQLLGRDEEIAELRRVEQALGDELEWRRKTEKSLREAVEGLGRDIEHLQRQLETVESTRIWRWGQRYWHFKASVRRAVLKGRL